MKNKKEELYVCRYCGKTCVSFECDCKKDKTLWNSRSRKNKSRKKREKLNDWSKK